MSDLKQELCNFEGSDALGVGDFSVCLRAAARIAELEAEVKGWRNEDKKKQTACEQMGNRIAKLEAALRKIADTDPDEGTNWFHDVANRALKGGKKDE